MNAGETVQHPNIDRLAEQLMELNRPGLIRMLQDLPCSFRLDFTDDFLNSVSVERLRHIILAAYLHLREPVSASAPPVIGG